MAEDRLTLADVFRAGFPQYLDANGPLPPQHYDVANAIMRCHSAALGGHVFRCDRCGCDRIAYNSCRNRHCPSCQAMARARWVSERTHDLLPVPYFHVVFTVPAQLNPFALRNKEAFYNILFAAASQTIRDLGRDHRRLGAETGAIMVLHTWGQNLMDHPHLHCILPAGGLDDDQWVACKNPRFLFPVKVMSQLFRGKFMAAFKAAIAAGEIQLHGQLEEFARNPRTLTALIDGLYTKPWVVYAKPPFGGPAAVLKYLGRYTHRIAISNSRLRALTSSQVTYQWKDYADGNRSKTMDLSVTEFIRRFLLHVLPHGFVRIRYFGFLANCIRAAKLQLCRDQTDPDRACRGAEEAAAENDDLLPAQQSPRRCPVCGQGHLVWRMDIPRSPVLHGAADHQQSHAMDPGGGIPDAA